MVQVTNWLFLSAQFSGTPVVYVSRNWIGFCMQVAKTPTCANFSVFATLYDTMPLV